MTFPTKRLNAKELPEMVVPRGKVYELRDGEGLVLRVREDAGASWQYVFSHRRRRWRYTIGPYPLMSLSQARAKHLAIRYRLRIEGINPVEEKRHARNRPTVTALAHAYLEHARPLQRDHTTVRSCVTRHVVPALGPDRFAEDLRLADMVSAVKRISTRHTPVVANRTAVYIREVFRHAIEQGMIEHNPAQYLRNPHPANHRARVLSAQELRDAWNIDTHPERRALIRLLIATGCRESEVRTAHWSDIEGNWLVIPATRTKTQREYRVYLNRHARAELERLSSRGYATHLFPGRTLTAPVGTDYARRPLRALGVDWQLHDLRRTMRTGLSRIGVAQHIAERALNHSVPGIEAIYNKHQFETELADALEGWAHEIERILAE